MPSRKRKPQHRKAVHVDLEDGWTFVTKSAKSKSLAKNVKPKMAEWGPETALDDMTVAKIETAYNRMRMVWRQEKSGPFSPEFGELVERAKETLVVDVRNAVCLGLGSLSGFRYRRSLRQLIFFMRTAELLSKSCTPLKFYAKDPRFNHFDVEFLEKLGVGVLAGNPLLVHRGNDATEVTNSHTFLYAPYLDCFVNLQYLENRYPAVYINVSMAEISDAVDHHLPPSSPSEYIQHLRKLYLSIINNFSRGRTEERLGFKKEFDEELVFDGMVIAWKTEDIAVKTPEERLGDVRKVQWYGDLEKPLFVSAPLNYTEDDIERDLAAYRRGERLDELY